MDRIGGKPAPRCRHCNRFLVRMSDHPRRFGEGAPPKWVHDVPMAYDWNHEPEPVEMPAGEEGR